LGIKGARLEEHIQLSLPKMTFIYGVVWRKEFRKWTPIQKKS
jgi:hypothetical protein